MEDIPVEAHSVLIRRLYTDKSPTTLMQFALSQLGVNKVCIMTTSEEHLLELITAVHWLSTPASEEHLLELITSVQRKTERLYPLKPAADPSTAIPTDIDTLSKLIENEIKEGHPSKINHKNTKKIDQVDNTNGTNDTNGTNGTNDTNDTNSIEKVKIQGFSLSGFIPGVKSPYSNMGRDVAKHLYGGLFETEFQAFVKFHALTKKARCEIEVQIKQNDLHNSGKTCCLLKRPKAKRDYLSDPSNTTPISEAVVNPTPMPVTVSPYDHLKPIFDVLQKDSDIIADVEFYKGALRPDAVDLCKQVVGPHIVELCKSLEGTHQMKHFLLGNNIAFEKDQKYANSMADLIKANQPPIETWYLAGNCIGPEAIQIMADAFCQNTVTNALWLKRNPILAQGIPPLVNMFNINRTITLLDLDNCGLLDEGAEALKELKNSAIKHIYLDSNGFTEKGAEYLGEFFKNNINTIKTFYVSVNRIQDAGLIHLLKGASESKVLKRFAVNSNRITDASLEQLAEFTLKMPQLKLLDVGYYKSTFDMGEKPNFFTKPEPFIRIIEQHPNLQHLDLTMNSLSEESALKVLDAAKKRNTLNLYASMLNSTKLSYEALPDKTFQKTLKHPKRVVHIESIYRNKM
jgi:hypothetical protein